MFAPKTRVLIVDDVATMRKLVAKVCTDLGLTDLTEAEDGEQAWDVIDNSATNPIGLVISDWNMPRLSGINLLRRVRADARHKSLPFLIVTSEVDLPHISEAVQAGADGYIVKPFSAKIMTEKLEAVHKKHITART